jgi:hypothetical protein
MKITPLGKSQFEISFVTKMAQDLISKQTQSEFDPSEFSNVLTEDKPVLISKLGLLGDLPEGVSPEMYTSLNTAKKLQKFTD